MASTPKPKFVVLSKKVHVIRTQRWDAVNSTCRSVKRGWDVDRWPNASTISAEAALALDGCINCGTEEIAKAALPATTKRAAAKDKTTEVLDRAAGKQTWYRTSKDNGGGWTQNIDLALKDENGEPVQTSVMPAGRKPRATKPAVVEAGKSAPKNESAQLPPTRIRKKGVVDPVERKPVEPTKTKAGFRSVGSGKAEQLRDFCNANGWKATLEKDVTPNGVVVVAKQAKAVINCWFVDGKYDEARPAEIRVGDWTGKLRGAHAVRRQVSAELDNRDRPHPAPGKGRSVTRTKVANEEVEESPEDAAANRPFLIDDDPAEIIDALLGKIITWRNSTTRQREEARVPSEVGKGKRPKVKISEHPTTGRRVLNFFTVAEVGEQGEVFGAERAVALDKITRVRPA